jgi:hypothetical protein
MEFWVQFNGWCSLESLLFDEKRGYEAGMTPSLGDLIQDFFHGHSGGSGGRLIYPKNIKFHELLRLCDF